MDVMENLTKSLINVFSNRIEKTAIQNDRLRRIVLRYKRKNRRMVSQLAEAQNNAIHWELLATTDPLTGLKNRLSFTMEQMALLSSGKQFAIILMDVDGLREVNNCCGHDQGDQLLIQFAKDLQRIFREGDIIFRLGGDEFVVILPDIESETIAQERIQQIQSMLGGEFTADCGKKVPYGASAGISYSEGIKGCHATMKEVIKLADTRMYADKNARKGTSLDRKEA